MLNSLVKKLKALSSSYLVKKFGVVAKQKRVCRVGFQQLAIVGTDFDVIAGDGGDSAIGAASVSVDSNCVAMVGLGVGNHIHRDGGRNVMGGERSLTRQSGKRGGSEERRRCHTHTHSVD